MVNTRQRRERILISTTELKSFRNKLEYLGQLLKTSFSILTRYTYQSGSCHLSSIHYQNKVPQNKVPIAPPWQFLHVKKGLFQFCNTYCRVKDVKNASHIRALYRFPQTELQVLMKTESQKRHRHCLLLQLSYSVCSLLGPRLAYRLGRLK